MFGGVVNVDSDLRRGMGQLIGLGWAAIAVYLYCNGYEENDSMADEVLSFILLIICMLMSIIFILGVAHA